MNDFNGVSDEVAESGVLIVVRKNINTKPKLWKIVGKSNVFKDNFICDAKNELLRHFHYKGIRLATNDEIKAGKRLDGLKEVT